MSEVISVSQSLQILMQATADVMDHREEGEQSGLIPVSITQEEAISLLIVYYMLQKGFETKISPQIMWNMLMDYCNSEIAESFPDWYIPIVNKKLGITITHDDIKKKIMKSFIDFPSFVARAIEVGNKEEWCPFKEPFSALWHAGYMLSMKRNGYYCDLDKDLLSLAIHPSFDIPDAIKKALLS